jgi:hypothetical protein
MKYLFFLLIFLQLQSYAQVADNVYSGTKGKFSTKSLSNSEDYLEITPTYTFPTGKLSDIYNNGYGGLITLNIKLNSGVILFVEGGYVSFIGKEINIRNIPSFKPASFIHIPVSAGFKHYEGRFIIGFGIGTGTSKLEGVDMENSTKLMLNPMAGYDFGKIILGANYSITSIGDIGDRNTNKYLGVRLSFKLK